MLASRSFACFITSLRRLARANDDDLDGDRLAAPFYCAFVTTMLLTAPPLSTDCLLRPLPQPNHLYNKHILAHKLNHTHARRGRPRITFALRRQL